MRLSAAVLGSTLLCAACAARQAPPVAGPAATRQGSTSVRVLESDSKAPQPGEAVAETITPAFASDENKLPEYPAYALKAGCREGTVPIRLHIGEDGNVARVSAVPDRAVADDACHSAFWAATYGAVRAWRFAPAFRQVPRPGADIDGDGRPDYTRWEQTPIMIYLDFEFSFRVVEGKGRVSSQ